MNPKPNLVCDYARRRETTCFLCSCGKHHNTLSGATYCCTSQKSEDCGCRHCGGNPPREEVKS